MAPEWTVQERYPRFPKMLLSPLYLLNNAEDADSVTGVGSHLWLPDELCWQEYLL